MSIVSEIRLTASRTINLGNYERTKVEGTVVVGRNDDLDTADKMREEALEELQLLLQAAEKDHVPTRRRRDRD